MWSTEAFLRPRGRSGVLQRQQAAPHSLSLSLSLCSPGCACVQLMPVEQTETTVTDSTPPRPRSAHSVYRHPKNR
jgi:hypothetical protein